MPFHHCTWCRCHVPYLGWLLLQNRLFRHGSTGLLGTWCWHTPASVTSSLAQVGSLCLQPQALLGVVLVSKRGWSWLMEWVWAYGSVVQSFSFRGSCCAEGSWIFLVSPLLAGPCVRASDDPGVFWTLQPVSVLWFPVCLLVAAELWPSPCQTWVCSAWCQSSFSWPGAALWIAC